MHGRARSVEDEVDLAATMEYSLAREGYHVTVAHSGQAAMAAALAEPGPDVVILDLMLPDLPGTEVCRRLREHDVMGMSAALCYRTIFTLIPVLVLGLLVAKSLGTLEDSKRSLRAFLTASGFAQIAIQDTESTAPPDATVAPSSAEAATTQPLAVINVADEIENMVTRV